MGQKVHPTGIRLGIIKDWTSKWYADSKDYANFLHTDLQIRDYLRKKLSNASVSRIQIERPAGNARIIIHTARPGIVIGKKGEDIERLRVEISKMLGLPAQVSVEEIRKPELDAYLVAESVAQQIQRRIMFRRAMKRAVTNTMRLGAGTPNIFDISTRRRSISSPFLPITIPGRAVCIMILALPAGLSICIRLTDALDNYLRK